MNPIHWVLSFLVIIFFLLYYVYPRRKDVAYSYLRYILLGIAAFLILSPFFWLLCSAIKDKNFLMSYTFLPPLKTWFSERALNFNNFVKLFEGETTIKGDVYFWKYINNSLFLATTSTVIQVFFASLGGYALAKYDFRGKKIIMGYMLGTMMFPPMLLLASLFKLIHQIGWMDTYYALLIPHAASVFGMFLFRQSMLSIPDSLIESARIDGCSEFKIYLKIIVPLVRPMTAAYCLISFLASWNAFIGPQIFIQTRAKLTLPVILNQYVDIYFQQYGVFLAGTLLAIIPPAILFFALEKEFVAGLTKGAVKG